MRNKQNRISSFVYYNNTLTHIYQIVTLYNSHSYYNFHMYLCVFILPESRHDMLLQCAGHSNIKYNRFDLGILRDILCKCGTDSDIYWMPKTVSQSMWIEHPKGRELQKSYAHPAGLIIFSIDKHIKLKVSK